MSCFALVASACASPATVDSTAPDGTIDAASAPDQDRTPAAAPEPDRLERSGRSDPSPHAFPPDPAEPAPDAVAPTRVRLPSLAVDAPVIGLDLRDDGTIEVPPDHTEAGWYRHGATPGSPGPTVLGAHVDWAGQPGVFRHLDRLDVGDRVVVARQDGTEVTYVVERREQRPKDDFPTFAVYGDTPEDTLRLVTCGGPFLTEQRSHRDNVIVYATALDAAG
ncbi:MAG: class F sortase [Nitriliruptoraceae bacterium]|nr:class F sortase [Nitriliruptoraceae bacterium]